MYSALVDVAVVVISFAHIPTFELIQHILNKPHTRARDFVKKERDYFLSSFDCALFVEIQLFILLNINLKKCYCCPIITRKYIYKCVLVVL